MNTVLVVVILEFSQLVRQIESIPEEYAIQIFAADRPNQPFHEGMRKWDVGHRLDLVDFEYAKVSKPLVKAKERVMIGAEVYLANYFSSGER